MAIYLFKSYSILCVSQNSMSKYINSPQWTFNSKLTWRKLPLGDGCRQKLYIYNTWNPQNSTENISNPQRCPGRTMTAVITGLFSHLPGLTVDHGWSLNGPCIHQTQVKTRQSNTLFSLKLTSRRTRLLKIYTVLTRSSASVESWAA